MSVQRLEVISEMLQKIEIDSKIAIYWKNRKKIEKAKLYKWEKN